ncbi:hypothetical protein [Olsenella uli]|uniref:hypothetical protein n=1 Tax=Olsenella uli TaxID=133926 RepID=UPI0024A85486|nr:hypothetical protein [Olsenella uli]
MEVAEERLCPPPTTGRRYFASQGWQARTERTWPTTREGNKDLAANKSTKNHRSKAGRQQAREAEAKAQAALDRLGEGERGIEILVPMLVKCRDDPPEGAYGYFRRGCAGHELTLEIGIVRAVRKQILWPPVAFLWPK